MKSGDFRGYKSLGYHKFDVFLSFRITSKNGMYHTYSPLGAWMKCPGLRHSRKEGILDKQLHYLRVARTAVLHTGVSLRHHTATVALQPANIHCYRSLGSSVLPVKGGVAPVKDGSEVVAPETDSSAAKVSVSKEVASDASESSKHEVDGVLKVNGLDLETPFYKALVTATGDLLAKYVYSGILKKSLYQYRGVDASTTTTFKFCKAVTRYLKLSENCHLYFVLFPGLCAEDIRFSFQSEKKLLVVEGSRGHKLLIEDALSAYKCNITFPRECMNEVYYCRMENGSLKILIDIDGMVRRQLPERPVKEKFEFGNFPGEAF